MAVTHYVKGDVDALRGRNTRVHLVLEPVLGNLLLHHAHVPGVARAEISAATGEAEAALGAVGTEVSIRPADRSALSEGNHVVGFDRRRRLRFLVGRADLWRRLCLDDLVRDRNRLRIRLFLYRLGL